MTDLHADYIAYLDACREAHTVTLDFNAWLTARLQAHDVALARLLERLAALEQRERALMADGR